MAGMWQFMRVNADASARRALSVLGCPPGAGDDPELLDLAVDRGAGDPERMCGSSFAVAVLLQTAHDRITFERLDAGERVPTRGPAPWRELADADHPGTLMGDHLS